MTKLETDDHRTDFDSFADGEVAFAPGRTSGPDRSTGTNAPSRRRSRDRRLSQRVSRGHVFGLLLGLLGFLLTWFLIGDAEATVDIYVAGEAVAAGQVIDLGSLDTVEVDATSPLASLGLRSPLDTDDLAAVRTIAAGDPILASGVTTEPLQDGLVDVAIEGDVAIGDVAVGDRVGVVVVVGQSSTAVASWLAVDALVITIDEGGSGGLVSAGSRNALTIAVTPSQALAVAAGQDVGALAIVATGADAVTIDVDERLVVSLDAIGRALPFVADTGPGASRSTAPEADAATVDLNPPADEEAQNG